MDRGIMATANELFEARHYPGVVALVNDALDGQPDCVPLLLVRARAHIALRRDLEAQADLRDIIRLDPQCSLAYRLLGELAARRDENESAAIFFREALRLDPGDQEADVWLSIVQATARPAAAAQKLPAPAAAAGRFPTRAPTTPRFAKGTHSPDDERPTARFTGVRPRPETEQPVRHASERPAVERPVASIAPDVMTDREIEALPPPPSVPAARFGAGSSPELPPYREPAQRPAFSAGAFAIAPQPVETFSPRTAEPEQRTKPGAQPVRRPLSEPGAQHHRGSVPEMPGFGEYLVSTGILTRERLRAAQAYQRSMRVQLATAIVTLGLATPQRIEWAAVAHQALLGRNG